MQSIMELVAPLMMMIVMNNVVLDKNNRKQASQPTSKRTHKVQSLGNTTVSQSQSFFIETRMFTQKPLVDSTHTCKERKGVLLNRESSNFKMVLTYTPEIQATRRKESSQFDLIESRRHVIE